MQEGAGRGGANDVWTKDMAVQEDVSARPSKGLFYAVFVFIGTAQVLGWNAILNCMSGVSLMVYNVPNFVDNVIVAHTVVLLLLTLLYMRVNVAKLSTLYWALILNVAVSLSFAFIVQFAAVSQPTNEPISQRNDSGRLVLSVVKRSLASV